MKKTPLTDEQKYIFDVNEESHGIHYNISFEIRFTKHFSSDQLRFAVEKCLLPADISGAKCVIDDGHQHMEFAPPQKPEIQAHRFPSEEHYRSYCDSIPEKEINNRDKLFHIFIYSIKDSFNQLHFCFNHVIFDGISAIILYHKIQKVLLDNSAEISWHPFSAHLDKIGRYRTGKNYLADQDFWNAQFAELSTCGYIFPDAIELNESAATSLRFQTSKEFKNKLLAYCAHTKTPPHLLIVSVFADLISKRYGCKRFNIEIPIGNRVGSKEKDSIGVYEMAAPFIFDLNKHPDFEDLLASAKNQAKDFYRHRNFDWNTKIYSPSCTSKYGNYISQIMFSYFCYNQDYSMGFATLHHNHSKICNLPINLYVSDYFEFETFSFYYAFWESHVPSEVVVEIQQELEANLVDIIENTPPKRSRHPQ